jgi:hypothetical protein
MRARGREHNGIPEVSKPQGDLSPNCLSGKRAVAIMTCISRWAKAKCWLAHDFSPFSLGCCVEVEQGVNVASAAGEVKLFLYQTNGMRPLICAKYQFRRLPHK